MLWISCFVFGLVHWQVFISVLFGDLIEMPLVGRGHFELKGNVNDNTYAQIYNIKTDNKMCGKL